MRGNGKRVGMEIRMFAVLKTGGKQYKVGSGDILRVEKLAAVSGETVQFNEILMVGDRVGEPFVEGAAVQAQVIDQIKDRKVIHFVRRRRKHGSKRTKGHRQRLTLLRVTDILETGAAETGVKEAVGAGSVPRDLDISAIPETGAISADLEVPPMEDTTPVPANAGPGDSHDTETVSGSKGQDAADGTDRSDQASEQATN